MSQYSSEASLTPRMESSLASGRKVTPMHAVVTHITVNDPEAAPIQMREDVVPAVSQSPGFVAGYWTRGDDGGMSMVVFESEDAAKALSERVPSLLTDAVTIKSIEVREVVAHA
jgi:hypothetical protein